MAFDESKTVGDENSGANYDLAHGSLQSLENAWDGEHEHWLATIISDFSDDVAFTGVGHSAKLTIEGKTGASKYTMSTQAGGSTMLSFSDNDVEEITIRDLIIDGTNQLAGQNGIYFSSVTFPATDILIERVRVTNCQGYGIYASTSAKTVGVILNNCIVDNALYGGYANLYVASATDWTLNNCGLYKCGRHGYDIGNHTNSTIHYNNCVSFEILGWDGFSTSEADSHDHLDFCVSYDGSANHANHETKTDIVYGAEDVNDYFEDWDGDDFHLAQSALDSWGKAGEPLTTPVVDFDNVTRSAGDIGPFEFLATTSSPNITPPVASSPISSPIYSPFEAK